MRIDRPAIKRSAKSVLLGSKPSPILVCLLALAIIYILSYLSLRMMGWDTIYSVYYNALVQGTDPSGEIIRIIDNIRAPAWVLLAALRILSFIISCGVTIYSLAVSRAQKAGFGTLFDGFGIFFKLIWVEILETIFILLWSLLLWFPGIIAMYRYRLAIYLLIDHPDWSALECIRESKRLMRGRKWELFVLDLSFLGWNILTYITVLASIWVTPYTSVTYAIYYDSVVAAQNGPIFGEYREY